jgi:hypothetical protein
MILEIAQIDVKPGMEAEFEAGVAKAAPVFGRAKGCSGMALQRSIEKPVMRRPAARTSAHHLPRTPGRRRRLSGYRGL